MGRTNRGAGRKFSGPKIRGALVVTFVLGCVATIYHLSDDTAPPVPLAVPATATSNAATATHGAPVRSKAVHTSKTAAPAASRPLVAAHAAPLADPLWDRKTATKPLKLPRASILCSGDSAVPSVFVIGGTKSGTTSMYNALKEAVPYLHPGHAVGGENAWAVKEKFYWTNKFNQKSHLWYLGHYPHCAGAYEASNSGDWNVYLPQLQTSTVTQGALDMTANMYIEPLVPQRLRAAYGDLSRRLTFIVMMKSDPLQLVHSSLYMRFNSERTPPTHQNFKETAKGQLTAAASCAKRGIDIFVQDAYAAGAHTKEIMECRQKTHNLRQACYAPFLEHWISEFTDDQFVFVSSASYFDAPSAIVEKLATELELPFEFSDIGKAVSDPSLANHNQKKPDLDQEDPDIVHELDEFFNQCRSRLSRLLRKHVVKGRSSFVGEIEPFIHE